MAQIINNDLLAKVRKMPCCQCGNPAPSDAHHLHHRNPRLDLPWNVIPLCRACHTRVHALGVASSCLKMSGYRFAVESLGWRLEEIFSDGHFSLLHPNLSEYR